MEISKSFPGLSKIRKFNLIEKGINTQIFIEELQEQRRSVKLSKTPPVHRESTHIGLRIAPKNDRTRGMYHGNVLENVATENYPLFPRLTKWMEVFAEENNGLLQRAFIAVLKPRGKVYPHFDAGIYFGICDRYHLVLRSEGTRVEVEDQNVTFREGEVWWFNNRLFHEFSHNSDEERIHLIFDLLPKSSLVRIKNFTIWAYLSFIHKLRGAGKTGAPPAEL